MSVEAAKQASKRVLIIRMTVSNLWVARPKVVHITLLRGKLKASF